MGQYESEVIAIRSRVSTRSLLEQLAEESAELLQAALKYIRASGEADDNPTPVSETDAVNGLVEEFGDVCLVAYILGINRTDPSENVKVRRWIERLEEMA